MRRSALTSTVASVAPQSASTVAIRVRGICSAGTTALQKLGQKSQSTIEPSIAKRSEVSSLSTALSRSSARVSARASPRPK